MTGSWEDKVAGRACPFDYPRLDNDEFVFIRKLSASSLYLRRNQTYRGHCVLIYDLAHLLRIDQLSTVEWSALAGEIRTAERAALQERSALGRSDLDFRHAGLRNWPSSSISSSLAGSTTRLTQIARRNMNEEYR